LHWRTYISTKQATVISRQPGRKTNFRGFHERYQIYEVFGTKSDVLLWYDAC
jgi:hypothetical protein